MLSLVMYVQELQNLHLVTATEAFKADFRFRRYYLLEPKHQWICKIYTLVHQPNPHSPTLSFLSARMIRTDCSLNKLTGSLNVVWCYCCSLSKGMSVWKSVMQVFMHQKINGYPKDRKKRPQHTSLILGPRRGGKYLCRGAHGEKTGRGDKME